MFTGAEHLPQDRETVYWLNVLEIPPKPKAGSDAAEDDLQLAVRSRLKLFYRPKGLQGYRLIRCPDQVIWHVVTSPRVTPPIRTNDTPFNVSFSDLTFKGSPQQQSVSKGGMCPAKGKAHIRWRAILTPAAKLSSQSLTTTADSPLMKSVSRAQPGV